MSNKEHVSRYESKHPGTDGLIHYSAEEDSVWHDLYARQVQIIPDRVCPEFIDGLKSLGLNQDQIPQLKDVNIALNKATGWAVEPVPALIPYEKFFTLLKTKHFPAATFIRCRDEFDYVTEPDIFHEFFGHCPLLCQQDFANFTESYGRLALNMSEEDLPLLQRLYWFTVEFGLIQHPGQVVQAYGGGIISSPGELVYATDTKAEAQPERKPFDLVDVFRTPFRIDQLQPIYFVINSFAELYETLQQDIPKAIAKARELGEHPPKFSVEDDNPNIHIFYC